MTTEDTLRSTALRVLDYGRALCDALVGSTSAPAVPARVRARASPSPEKVLASMIQGTCTQIGSGSSMRPVSRASLGLQRCLSSRLQARASGSILYNLVWKIAVLPSGMPIYRLRASPRGLIYDNGFTGWPTATTPSGGQTWPEGTSATGRRPDGSKATVNLEQVSRLAGWPTATVQNAAHATLSPGEMVEVLRGELNLHAVVHLAGWTTTTKDDTNRRTAPYAQGGHALSLQAHLSGWATTTRDHRSDRSQLTSEALYGSKGQPLARQALYSDATGSSVTTPKSGLLNPEHSRWLLRIPEDFGRCASTAMVWTSKRR